MNPKRIYAIVVSISGESNHDEMKKLSMERRTKEYVRRYAKKTLKEFDVLTVELPGDGNVGNVTFDIRSDIDVGDDVEFFGEKTLEVLTNVLYSSLD